MIFYDKESEIKKTFFGFLELVYEIECHLYINDMAVNVLTGNG